LRDSDARPDEHIHWTACGESERRAIQWQTVVGARKTERLGQAPRAGAQQLRVVDLPALVHQLDPV